MDERPAGRRHQVVEALERRGNVRSLHVDRRAVLAGGGDLHRARGLPHDDECVDAFDGRGVGESLRVVAGGDRDDAATLFVF